MVDNKNQNYGKISTDGGDVFIGDTYYTKSVEYSNLLTNIEKLEKLVQLSTDKDDIVKYTNELWRERDKLDDFKKEVIKLAQIFQKIEINNKRLKQAKEYFTNGLYKEARQVLDTEESKKELNDLLEEKNRLEKETAENTEKLKIKSNESLILAKLKAFDYSDDNWYETTINHFQSSINANRNYLNLLEFGLFLSDHKQLSKALPIYTEVVDIAFNSLEINKNVYFDNLAMAYANLAVAKNMIGRIDEAIILNKKAIDSYQQINKKVGIAICKGNLGIAHIQLGKYQEAEQYLIGTLNLYSQLIEEDNSYIYEYAGTSMNLANLYLKLDLFTKAEQQFQKSLNIYEEFEKLNEGKFEEKIADVHNNMGNLYTKNLMLKKGEHSYKEALRIYNKLLVSNHRIFLPDKAMILNNLGILYSEKEENSKSEEAYLESKKIRYSLAEANPKVYLPDIILTNVNLSSLYISMNQLNKAKEVLEEVISISKKDVLEKDNIQQNLAKTYSNFYTINLLSKNYKKALSYIKKANSIWERLSKIESAFIPFYIISKEKIINLQNKIEEENDSQ